MPDGLLIKPNHIILDQNLSDPSKMIYGDVNSEAIQWIRANSHRYLGKYTGEGQMTICQLSDDNNGGKTDAVYFADTNYTYIDNPENDGRCDWFMRLPKFYYHAEEVDPDIWDIGFGQEPEADDWKEWDGKDLIGVYEAYRESNSLFSRSGVVPLDNKSYSEFKSYAQARGTGYSLVKWKHHSMMAFLFYAMYGNTNSQAICGAGTEDVAKTTGQTDSLGMVDTVAGGNGDSGSINFWGLENWWGDIREWMDNISLDIPNTLWSITEDDGSVRYIEAEIQYMLNIGKLVIGDNLDAIPIDVVDSDNIEDLGFCDGFDSQARGTINPADRSGYGNYRNCGVVNIRAFNTNYYNYGSRLAFRGDIIVENDVPTFRSIPITNDGYSGTTSP